jgi:hypothetical protein
MNVNFAAIMLLASSVAASAANEVRVLDRSCGQVLCTAMLAIEREIVGGGTKAVVEFVSAPAQTLDSVMGVKRGARHTFTAFCSQGTIRDEEDRSSNSLVQIRETLGTPDGAAVPPEKAQLHTRLLKAAMDYACAPGAEVAVEPLYYGTWATNLEQCADPESDAKTRFDGKGMTGWESHCEVKRAIQSQPSQWWLVMDCEGEGETWKSTYRLTLLGKSKLLIEHGAGTRLSRFVQTLCPAEPKAP